MPSSESTSFVSSDFSQLFDENGSLRSNVTYHFGDFGSDFVGTAQQDLFIYTALDAEYIESNQSFDQVYDGIEQDRIFGLDGSQDRILLPGWAGEVSGERQVSHSNVAEASPVVHEREFAAGLDLSSFPNNSGNVVFPLGNTVQPGSFGESRNFSLEPVQSPNLGGFGGSPGGRFQLSDPVNIPSNRLGQIEQMAQSVNFLDFGDFLREQLDKLPDDFSKLTTDENGQVITDDARVRDFASELQERFGTRFSGSSSASSRVLTGSVSGVSTGAGSFENVITSPELRIHSDFDTVTLPASITSQSHLRTSGHSQANHYASGAVVKTSDTAYFADQSQYSVTSLHSNLPLAPGWSSAGSDFL